MDKWDVDGRVRKKDERQSGRQRLLCPGKKKRVQDRKLKSLSSSLLFSDFGSRSRGDVDVEGRVSTWVVALAKT